MTLIAPDAYSGVATTNYTIDGLTHLYAGAPFLVAGNGSHTVTYWSTDAAGNAEAVHTGYVNIDTTAPVTTATGLQASGSSGWQNVSQVVSLAGSDGLSGVAATYYTLDGGARQTYASPFTVSAQGTHTDHLLVGRCRGQHRGDKDRLRQHRSGGADRRRRRRRRLAQERRHRASDARPTPAARAWPARSTACRATPTWSAATGNAFVVPAPPDGSGDGARVYQYRALDNAGNSSAIRSCTSVDRRHGADHHGHRPGRRRPLAAGAPRARR